MYATGRGVKADPVQAARWHLIARAGGDNDLFLEDFLRKMKPEDRAAGEAAAKPWIARLRQRIRSPGRSTPASAAALTGVRASRCICTPEDLNRRHSMAKISGSDIRPGMVIEYDGSLWAAVKTGAVKPGKGPAYNQVELKNLLDGRKLNQRFGSADRVEETEVERRQFQFLYRQDDQLVFMDTASYDQIELAERIRRRPRGVPAGRHDGAGAVAPGPADRHQAAGHRGARSGRGRRHASRARPRRRPTSRRGSKTACACWCRRSSRPAKRSSSTPTRSPT